MKILTLNTHSLIEENYHEKLEHFVSVIAEEKPDIIAMQESSQTSNGDEISADKFERYFPSGDNIKIFSDNHTFILKAISNRA